MICLHFVAHLQYDLWSLEATLAFRTACVDCVWNTSNSAALVKLASKRNIIFYKRTHCSIWSAVTRPSLFSAPQTIKRHCSSSASSAYTWFSMAMISRRFSLRMSLSSCLAGVPWRRCLNSINAPSSPRRSPRRKVCSLRCSSGTFRDWLAGDCRCACIVDWLCRNVRDGEWCACASGNWERAGTVVWLSEYVRDGEYRACCHGSWRAWVRVQGGETRAPVYMSQSKQIFASRELTKPFQKKSTVPSGCLATIHKYIFENSGFGIRN